MRPLRILKVNTIPKPCEHDGGCFAKTGWDVYELRTADCARIAASKPSLVVERSLIVTSGEFEKTIKVHTFNKDTNLFSCNFEVLR
jgi:hypothetical protein